MAAKPTKAAKLEATLSPFPAPVKAGGGELVVAFGAFVVA